VALVGADGNDDNGPDSGSAYVFRYQEVTPGTWDWVQEKKLLPSDGAADDHFGYWLSISGDVALVTAPGDSDNGDESGSAYVFRYQEVTPGTWDCVQEQKLFVPAPDGAAGDRFGESVSIRGDVALVGADGNDENGEDSGSAYVYRLCPVNPDTDGDGIQDGIDGYLDAGGNFVDESTFYSRNFTNQHLGGTTYGVVGVGNVAMISVEQSDPNDAQKGVDIRACGVFYRQKTFPTDTCAFRENLTSGDSFENVTCGSITGRVQRGQIEFQLLEETLEAIVPSQTTVKIAKFGDGLFEVENVEGTGTITIEDQGQLIELGTGESTVRGECDEDEIIVSIQNALNPEKFKLKDYTGLTKKLDHATTKFEEGKCEDARDKLNDFQNKVVQLATEEKIEKEYANSLLNQTTEAIKCAEACVEVQ
jgi:hypothetical protein